MGAMAPPTYNVALSLVAGGIVGKIAWNVWNE